MVNLPASLPVSRGTDRSTLESRLPDRSGDRGQASVARASHVKVRGIFRPAPRGPRPVFERNPDD